MPPTPLVGAYCNALPLAQWPVCQKLKSVSSVQLRRYVIRVFTVVVTRILSWGQQILWIRVAKIVKCGDMRGVS